MLKKTLLGCRLRSPESGGQRTNTGRGSAPSAIKRTPLQKVENFPPGYNIVTVVGEIAPGGSAGRHTHPGVDTGYVMEGEGTFSIEGMPDRVVKPGDSWAVPAGVVHDVKVNGDKPLKYVGIYVVEKDKPMASRPRRSSAATRFDRHKGFTWRPFLLKNTLLAGRLRPALRFATRGLLHQAYGADLSAPGPFRCTGGRVSSKPNSRKRTR